MSPGVFVLVTVTVTTPASGVTVPVGLMSASVGVTLKTLIAGVLAFVTVFPFGSLSATVTVEMPADVVPPLAMIEVGLAVQPSCVAWPNTVRGALPDEPGMVAITVQGCVAEFIAVAAKSPVAVTA